MLGATYLFYDKEKKNAVAQIVEMKAGTKQEEQTSEDPKDKIKTHLTRASSRPGGLDVS